MAILWVEFVTTSSDSFLHQSESDNDGTRARGDEEITGTNFRPFLENVCRTVVNVAMLRIGLVSRW